jgi:hypothetical protein
MADRIALAEAAMLLGLTRAIVLAVPFRIYCRLLGRHMAEAARTDAPAHAPAITRVKWAVATMGRHLPWECNCMNSSITGTLMLRRRGIPSTMYLGVVREAPEKIKAHAWLRAGTQIIVGAPVKQFTVVSTFAQP